MDVFGYSMRDSDCLILDLFSNCRELYVFFIHSVDNKLNY